MDEKALRARSSHPPKNVLYTQEVNTFLLWFEPYEEKVLEVSYDISASFFYYYPSFFTSYDFSPIFSWKWAKVGEVEIQ